MRIAVQNPDHQRVPSGPPVSANNAKIKSLEIFFNVGQGIKSLSTPGLHSSSTPGLYSLNRVQ